MQIIIIILSILRCTISKMIRIFANLDESANLAAGILLIFYFYVCIICSYFVFFCPRIHSSIQLFQQIIKITVFFQSLRY